MAKQRTFALLLMAILAVAASGGVLHPLAQTTDGHDCQACHTDGAEPPSLPDAGSVLPIVVSAPPHAAPGLPQAAAVARFVPRGPPASC